MSKNSATLSPHRALLLAAHLTTSASISSLAFLAWQHASVLREDVLLRLLLTYLPETTSPSLYVPLLLSLSTGTLHDVETVPVDTSSVDALSDEEAVRKAKKLHLLFLGLDGLPPAFSHEQDSLVVFLLRRAYRVDQEAGLLTQLPDLLLPFVTRSTALRRWILSVLLPLTRRTCQYYSQSARGPTPSLQEFESLPDEEAVEFLLSSTGATEESLALVGRDLRGLIGPWLLGDGRWKSAPLADDTRSPSAGVRGGSETCTAWERVQGWLASQAASNWTVAVRAVEQWKGPGDIDLGPGQDSWLEEGQRLYLDNRYGRSCLAAAYLISESTPEALAGAYSISSHLGARLLEMPRNSVHEAASDLSMVADSAANLLARPKARDHRKSLLDDSNIFTSPDEPALRLLQAFITSAFILTRNGYPCSIRKSGDLLLLGDEREQKAELKKTINAASARIAKADDSHWVRCKNEILWLHNWGRDHQPPPSINGATAAAAGLFGKVSREFLETEFLTILLAQSRFSLARSLYGDASPPPLPTRVLQDTVHSAAMHAYDKATNPNRTRGGLKKCNDIIHAFPETMQSSMDSFRRTEALLRATHTLSNYRLVLKQGEPFSPVVLRIHSDPISIIARVLEQNPGSYTALQEFLDLGSNMVRAGLGLGLGHRQDVAGVDSQSLQLTLAERRITAMCVEQALHEDDFETAYSYVISRLASTDVDTHTHARDHPDSHSWSAALLAGQYVRTGRSIRPTHLGTASGNLDIRHLEQRIDCLSVALRIAPASRLQDILKTFRRCEEQLDSALRDEAAREEAWDAAADFPIGLPGSFADTSDRRDHNRTRPAAMVTPLAGRSVSVEAAPMSLLDLSRATARIASQNFSALSGLRKGVPTSRGPAVTNASHEIEREESHQSQIQKTRKRDQLRDVAVGTLVSGVGWLINANPTDKDGSSHG